MSEETPITQPKQPPTNAGSKVLNTIARLFIVGIAIFSILWMISPVNKNNYDKIQVGMSLSEVDKIMDPTEDVSMEENSTFTGEKSWIHFSGPLFFQKGQSIVVIFKNGVVVNKAIGSKSKPIKMNNL